MGLLLPFRKNDIFSQQLAFDFGRFRLEALPESYQ
jgi:hypothetical protein